MSLPYRNKNEEMNRYFDRKRGKVTPNSTPTTPPNNQHRNTKNCNKKLWFSIIGSTILFLLLCIAVLVPFSIVVSVKKPYIVQGYFDPCSLLWDPDGYIILGDGSAGLGSNQLDRPSGIYIDSNDILYVADFGNYRVQKMVLSTGVVTTIAGNGFVGSTDTQFGGPEFPFFDGNQNLYVSDYSNYRVQKFSAGSLNGTTIAGTGTRGNTTTELNGPKYLWLDSSYQYLYLADSMNHRIIRFLTNSASGTPGTVVAGGFPNGNNVNQLNNPQGIFYDTSTNSMYITNCNGHTVIKWKPGDSSGTFVAGISGQSGSSSSLLNCPSDVRVDQYNNIYVADSRNSRIQMFCENGGGQAITIAGGNATGNSTMQFANPRSLQFDSKMNLYVSDTSNHRIMKFVKL